MLARLSKIALEYSQNNGATRQHKSGPSSPRGEWLTWVSLMRVSRKKMNFTLSWAGSPNSVFSIYNRLQVRKRASSRWGPGSLGLLEAMKGEGHNFQYFGAWRGKPPHSSHQHSGREAVQLDGLPAQQKKAPLVRRRHVHAAFPEGQYRALILWWNNYICK